MGCGAVMYIWHQEISFCEMRGTERVQYNVRSGLILALLVVLYLICMISCIVWSGNGTF
jgi:hypothetical protein